MRLPLTPLEALPLILTAVLAVALLLFMAGWILSRIRPPTSEPVIGHYRFILKGSGLTVEGITTTARSAAHPQMLSRLGEAAEKLRGLLSSLHLYAVRDGRRRILVIADRPVETAEYSDSEREPRFVFPHGWISYRNVYGYGVEVTPETHPEFFRFFGGDWDGALFIYPENIRTGEQRNPGILKKAEELTQTLLLVKQAALAVERAQALEDVLEVKDRVIRELERDVAHAVDQYHLAQRRSLLSTPFASEAELPKRRGLLPRMTKWRILSILAVAALSWWWLPKHSTLSPNAALIFGAAATYLFWLIWDRGLREVFTR